MYKNRLLETAEVDPKTLKAHALNFREHPIEQRAALTAGLNELGYVQRITVSKRTNTVLDGHARLEDALETGQPLIPIQYVDLDENEERMALASLDKIASMAYVNDKVLAELLAQTEAQTEDFELFLRQIQDETPSIGDIIKDASEPEPSDKEVAQQEWQVKEGDVWLVKSAKGGTHRLICGSCTDEKTVKRLFKGQKKASLLLTDPPYGVSYVSTKDGMARGGFANIGERFDEIENDTLSVEDLEKLLTGALKACLPFTTKPAIYMFGPQLGNIIAFFKAYENVGALVHRQIIWAKEHFVITRSGMYHWKHEVCLFGWVKGDMPEWYGEKNQHTIWESPHGNRGDHPTAKPLGVWLPPILNHTLPGQIVLEPFGGSGSLLEACEEAGRLCYYIELDPAYVAVALARAAALGLSPVKEG